MLKKRKGESSADNATLVQLTIHIYIYIYN